MEWLFIWQRLTKERLQYFMLLVAGLLLSVLIAPLINQGVAVAVDAHWKDQSLQYQNEIYDPVVDASVVSDVGLPKNSLVYKNEKKVGDKTEVNIIYFEPGTDTSSTTSAKFVSYDFSPPKTYTKKSEKNISTEPLKEKDSRKSGTSCDVAAIGWIVCPLSNWLAAGMDWLYDRLADFLKTEPIEVGNSKNGLYMAWEIMRNIANVAFIIAFLIIIYSQITSVGISNYGVKKMLPRLIVAAILVNMSYYICAIAIDTSNISGMAIQDIFSQIRGTVISVGESNSDASYSWQSITSAILAGGAVSASVVIGAKLLLVGTGGVASAAMIILLPMLLGLVLTLLVVLLVVSARQALIVILTIISPLAFVCYILPGTEKWFEKWRSTFFTMLIFFPAFSVVFGGSQLASAAIIQNSSSIIMAILGLGVQVAPLALAPLILKLSGGLLNRFSDAFGGLKKGIVGHARDMSQDHGKYLANKRSLGLTEDDLKRRNFLRRAGQRANSKERQRKERYDNYQAKADAAYAETKEHAELDKQRREIDNRRQIADKQLDIKWNENVINNQQALEKDLKLRVLIDKANLGDETIKTRYEEFKTGQGNKDYGLQNLRNEAHKTSIDIAVQGLATQSAMRVQKSVLAKAIEQDTDLQRTAGSIEDMYFGQGRGSQRVLASALQTAASANEESIKNAEVILAHGNYTDRQKAEMAIGNSFANGPTVTSDIQKAAIHSIFGGKNDVDLTYALKNMDLGNMNEEIRQEIGDTLLKNSDKPIWLGAKVAADIKGSNIGSGSDVAGGGQFLSGQKLFNKIIENTVNTGKLGSAEKLVSQTPGYIKEVIGALPNIKITDEKRNEIIDQIILAKTDPSYSGRIGEKKSSIAELYNELVTRITNPKFNSYDDIV